jgi:hypothetical protein
MSTDLETRLAAALHARADQVTPDLLRPDEMPRAAGHAWRWALAGLAAAAAVAAAVVVSGHLRDPEPPPVAQAPPVSVLDRLPLTPVDGETSTYDDGLVGTLEDGELVLTGARSRLTTEDLGTWLAHPRLTTVTVPLGRGHTGYVVVGSDPRDGEWVVVTPWHDRLVPVTWPVEHLDVAPDVGGFTTWIGPGPQLLTRADVPGTESPARVLTWTFPRPGTLQDHPRSIPLVASTVPAG